MTETTLQRQKFDGILDQAIVATHAGDRVRAQELLQGIIRQDADYVQAWFLLALATDDPRRARMYLRQVLRIDPDHRRAQHRLHQVEQRLAGVRSQMVAVTELQPAEGIKVEQLDKPFRFEHSSRNWLLIGLLAVALLIVVGGFTAQTWVGAGSNLPWAAWLTPSITPTLTPTPTPTLTPTPTNVQRVGRMIPELEQAWSAQDWQSALDVLNRVVLIDPAYPGLAEARCDTLRHWAQEAVAQGQIDQAYVRYRQASESCPGQADLEQGRMLALTYLAGLWRCDHGLWREAAAMLSSVYQVDPGYARTRELLHSAYVSWASLAMDEGELYQAQAAAEAALALSPEDEAMAALLAETKRLLVPTPTPALPRLPAPAATGGKRIEVNLSQQRMYVWQGDTLLYTWVCSSGEPGRNTAMGQFQVLNKIPEAWASTWSLRMPYWLGIYQAGPLQNGIHALPILPNGQILWAGYLGAPVSYGCIILSTENARTLYNWAEIGTPVWIHY